MTEEWKEMKVEEIRTDNTKTLKNALERIAELEEKTSVLLSCENCPENKDGLICRKEYENKCLAQKIQFIKELQQENAELKARLNAINQLIPELEKENAELKKQIPVWHNLRKNPDDLPNTDRMVFLQTMSDSGKAYYNGEGWISSQVSGIIIAWCEIPRFDGE